MAGSSEPRRATARRCRGAICGDWRKRKTAPSLRWQLWLTQAARSNSSISSAARRGIEAVVAQIGQDADRLLGCKPTSSLMIDESSFAKQGNRSVDVALQWSGRLSKVDNCQVGDVRSNPRNFQNHSESMAYANPARTSRGDHRSLDKPSRPSFPKRMLGWHSSSTRQRPFSAIRSRRYSRKRLFSGKFPPVPGPM